MKLQPTLYWVPGWFRKLTDEQIGAIQHRIHDLQEKVADLATEFGVSTGTIYRVRNAVPKNLITVDEAMLKSLRRRAARGRKKGKAA